MAKKTRELSDTAALQKLPAYAAESSEYRSVHVRQIDNGYITRESSHKDGECVTSEKYSEKMPDMVEQGGNSMKKAVEYMRRNNSI